MDAKYWRADEPKDATLWLSDTPTLAGCVLRYRFSRAHRLSKPTEFQAVFDLNQVRVSTPELLLLARRNDQLHPRLGLVMRKKFVRLATDRNHIKRCARESFRLRQHKLPGLDCVVLTRPPIDALNKRQLRERIDYVFDTLIRKAQTSS
jgi:ribonuclease P protein component